MTRLVRQSYGGPEAMTWSVCFMDSILDIKSTLLAKQPYLNQA